MSQIILPPKHQRSTAEMALLLFVGVVLPVAILFFLYREVTVKLPVATIDSEAVRTPLGATNSPVAVSVILQWPTATPTETPSPVPTSKPVQPTPDSFCDANTKPGDMCQQPPLPTPTPTPFPLCSDKVQFPDWCWMPAPTPKGPFS